MFASERMRCGVVFAAFSCLFVGLAVAQEEIQNTAQSESPDARRDESDQPRSGQTDRARTQQGERSATERTGRSYQSSQRETADIHGSRTTRDGAQQEVEQYLAGCLLAKNQSEVDLSQFAQEQSQNPEVKKFAQRMVHDHQKVVQQLQQVAGNQSQSSRGSTNSQFQRTNSENDRSGTSGNSSSLRTNDQSADDSEPVRNRSQRSATSTSTSANGLDQDSTESSNAIQQLMQIDRQIVERQAQATREELQQKSGVEFDKCFVGTAIVAHVQMIAALEVIEQQGQGQVAQIAQKARPVAEQHLEHAKQLMKQLEGNASTNRSQAERQSRTQR
jgi:predicted outer membrane protein